MTSKVTLHWLNSSRAQRTLWLMTELQVPYDVEIYHREKTAFAPAALEKVHPLGKSPVITVQPAAPEEGGGGGGPAPEPVVLAESGFITEYLCAHWGQGSTLVPAKWQAGREGEVGGETAAWLRYQYLLYYAEGSLMPYLVFFLVTSTLKSGQVPFFVRPISSAIANRINGVFILPNLRRHFRLLESFLAAPPAPADGAGYLCGGHLTAADILLSYPLLAARRRSALMGPWQGGSVEAEFPKLAAYLARLEQEPGYRASIAAIEKLDGRKFALLPDDN